MDEGAFVLDYFLPAGTSLTDTDAVARKIEAVLRDDPRGRHLLAPHRRRARARRRHRGQPRRHHGAPEAARASGSASAEEVIAEARATRRSARSPRRASSSCRCSRTSSTISPGTPRPLEIKLFGADYARALRAKAQEVAERVEGVPGLVDLYARLRGRRARAAAAPRRRRRRPPRAHGRGGHRRTSTSRCTARSPRSSAAPTAPSACACATPTPSASTESSSNSCRSCRPRAEAHDLGRCRRRASSARRRRAFCCARTFARRSIVTADHEGRDLGSVVGDVQDRLRGLALPEGYTTELGGQYRAQQETFRDLARVLGLRAPRRARRAAGAVPPRADGPRRAGLRPAGRRRRPRHAGRRPACRSTPRR